MKLRRLLALVLLVSVVAGCAHVSPRRRLARTLVATGAVAAVLGGLVTAGCVDSEAGSGCTGGADSANLGAGIPIMVVGAALITAGFLVRPPQSPRLFKPSSPMPVPVMPDPFVPPLQWY